MNGLVKNISNLFSTIFKNNSINIISIAGPGGCGKSSFAALLSKSLNSDFTIIKTDDYRLPRKLRESKNILGSNPEGNYLDLLFDHLSKLKRNKIIAKPIYNHIDGSADSTENISPKKFILLEGEMSAQTKLLPMIDFIIYLTSDDKILRERRIERDFKINNFSLLKAEAVYRQSNLIDFPQFNSHLQTKADLIIKSNRDFRYSLIYISDRYKSYWSN